jgi:hypothetical protein
MGVGLDLSQKAIPEIGEGSACDVRRCLNKALKERDITGLSGGKAASPRRASLRIPLVSNRGSFLAGSLVTGWRKFYRPNRLLHNRVYRISKKPTIVAPAVRRYPMISIRIYPMNLSLSVLLNGR